MILTKDMIEAGATPAGGWNRSQLAILGVTWPPRAGWKTRIVGKEYPEETLNQFKELGRRGTTKSPTTISAETIQGMISSVDLMEQELARFKEMLREAVLDRKLDEAIDRWRGEANR